MLQNETAPTVFQGGWVGAPSPILHPLTVGLDQSGLASVSFESVQHSGSRFRADFVCNRALGATSVLGRPWPKVARQKNSARSVALLEGERVEIHLLCSFWPLFTLEPCTCAPPLGVVATMG